MALSGDPIKSSALPSIRLDKEVLINNSGLVSDDPRDHWVRGVVEVVSGDIDQTLHLIGYEDHDIYHLLNDGCLSSTDEVIEKLKQFGARSPGSFLLIHSNRVYAVIVDHKNECRVIGQINAVIPYKDNTQSKDMNVVIVGKDGSRRDSNSRSFDIKQMVSSGVVFGIVSEGGFAVIETDINTSNQDFARNLVLVANKGYFIFEESKVDWKRLEVGLRKEEFAVKMTTLMANEILVTRSAAYIRDNDRYVVFGGHNAVFNFNAFQNMMNAMTTVGHQNTTTDDNSNSELENQNSSEEKCSQTLEVGPKPDSEVEPTFVSSETHSEVETNSNLKPESDLSVEETASDGSTTEYDFYQ